MNKISKGIIAVFIVALFMAGGYYWGLKSQLFKSHESESSTVMLNKIQKVFKMVAVEGHVSEIYDYKAYNYWDVNFLRKKVLVRVKAKVSIGYDLEKANFYTDEKTKTIRISPFPEPEILSVDHELDYYDMNEGLFNEFTEADLNKINRKAKEYTLTKIEESELFEQAEAQKDEIIELLQDVLGGSGWTIEVANYQRPFKG